uniref:Glycosyl transferase n=1 Tax=Desulfovibrio sp. U5L TaxID=596152 RepID=I2Q7R4_9BACT
MPFKFQTKDIELSIVMPCLNEIETLAICIEKAKSYLEAHNVCGEVLIADNGSTDGSREIAAQHGARIVAITQRGYGAALLGGIAAAKGCYVIMGDADDSYDFEHIDLFVEKLRQGYDLVMGNRFKGGIAKGAMPPLHQYLGNPVLSFLGRLFYNIPIGDFHCGLRGFNTESIRSLELRSTGMEFASEMVIQAALQKKRIAEVPTTLSPDGRSRPPHLRTWHDGWRHLKLLLLCAPHWLYYYPGGFLTIFGLLIMLFTGFGAAHVGSISFENKTFLVGCFCLLAGVQATCFGLMTSQFTVRFGIRTASSASWLPKFVTLDRMVLAAGIACTVGLFGALTCVCLWGATLFGPFPNPIVDRLMTVSLTFVAMGIQLFFTGFLTGMVGHQAD